MICGAEFLRRPHSRASPARPVPGREVRLPARSRPAEFRSDARCFSAPPRRLRARSRNREHGRRKECFCFADSSAIAKYESRGTLESILTKSRPRFFTVSTAWRASSGVFTAMVCRSLFPPARNGPARIMCGPSNSPLSIRLAAALEHVGIATHVAHAGHAVGDVQRVDHLFIPCRGNEGAVHMHVPQTWDHVFSVGIDDLNVRGPGRQSPLSPRP